MSQVKFYSCVQADYDAITSKNADHVYFCVDTNRIYKGEHEFTKTVKTLSGTPTESTPGDDGRLYAYNGNLYMCTVADNSYIWTRVANVGSSSGTVSSVTILGSDGISVDDRSAITGAGTRTLTHDDSGATAGSYGPTEDSQLAPGDSIEVPVVTINAKGHVTAIATHTLTLPSGEGVTPEEKQTWNNKYDKPEDGIPKTDLADDVQGELDKADVALEIVDSKMDSVNPEGTGSFSLNRKSNTTIGTNSFAEGYHTTASASYSHSEGYATTASAEGAHSEGSLSKARGRYSHAEGDQTTASGLNSHAEGFATTASGSDSHAEGGETTASGNTSHAEGNGTEATGDYSHAEGYHTHATGEYSHSEGCITQATGKYSHSEGYDTEASGESAHAEGYGTVAASPDQHVQGKYNIVDTHDVYAHIVGNGDEDVLSNAHTLDWSGNAWFAGTVSAENGFSGIQKSNLPEEVQESLNKADTALQSVSYSDISSILDDVLPKVFAITSGTCTANTTTTFTVNFDKTYSKVPRVVATVYANTAYNERVIRVANNPTVTESSATIGIYNPYSADQALSSNRRIEVMVFPQL